MNMILLAYYMAFFAIAFAWPTWRLWKQHGINGLVLPRDDSAHAVIGLWFKGLIGAVFALVVTKALGVDSETFAPLKWAHHDWVVALGWILLAGSAGWITVAQYQMGKAWRVGIDTATPTELATSGLFARSRNPIFLGMRINMVGLFLVTPCAPTLAIMLLSEALIGVQVRLEEAFLAQAHGTPYRDYQQRTPRWI